MYDQGYQTGRGSNLLLTEAWFTRLQVCRDLIYLHSKILDHSQKATYNLCFMQESIENIKRLHIFCSSKFSFKYVHLNGLFFYRNKTCKKTLRFAGWKDYSLKSEVPINRNSVFICTTYILLGQIVTRKEQFWQTIFWRNSGQ